MTIFIDWPGDITKSTDSYHQEIETWSKEIIESNDLTRPSHLPEVMQGKYVIQAGVMYRSDSVARYGVIHHRANRHRH